MIVQAKDTSSEEYTAKNGYLGEGGREREGRRGREGEGGREEHIFKGLNARSQSFLETVKGKLHVYRGFNSLYSTIMRTDMVDGSSTELPIEFLGSKLTEVFNGERPQMQDIVS